MTVRYVWPSRDVTARTTGVVEGRRVYRVRTFHRVTRIELNFVPAGGTRPTQARILHHVFDPRVRVWRPEVDLVVQADLEPTPRGRASGCTCPEFRADEFDGRQDHADACRDCPVHGTVVRR